MKDLTYYEGSDLKRPNLSEIRDPKLKALDDIPLTRSERDRQRIQVMKEAKAEYTSALRAYCASRRSRLDQFWQDARTDLQYGDLGENVIKYIEDKAYEDGHAYGFGEVLDNLEDLVDLCKLVRKSVLEAKS